MKIRERETDKIIDMESEELYMQIVKGEMIIYKFRYAYSYGTCNGERVELDDVTDEYDVYI